MSNCHGSRLSTFKFIFDAVSFTFISISETAFFFASMVNSRPFLPMLVVYIDNVKRAEVITSCSLQKIKIVYGGLFGIKISKIENF